MSDITIILFSVGFFLGCATSCIMFYICFGESQRSVGDESLYAIARRARSSELDLDSPVQTRVVMRPSAPPQASVYNIEEGHNPNG
jgi:hypothetical protein